MNSRLRLLALAASALALAGCGSNDDGGPTSTRSTRTTTSTSATTSTGAMTTPTTTTGDDCSAAGTALRVTVTTDLPPAVNTTRNAIATAAVNCDYDTLQTIIDRHPDQFQFQAGAGASEQTAIDYWKSIDAKEHVMLRLSQLLAAQGAELTEGAVVTHVWPAVHAGRRTDADWQELVESGAYTEQEVAAFRTDDLYFGYRVGILPDGTWSYFVAGD
ncbi:MAG: hypothetical protein JWN72_1179 [Thermoleophilia bacterium]|nr:hypothetical protein [Thermoleophilia bacterium]